MLLLQLMVDILSLELRGIVFRDWEGVGDDGRGSGSFHRVDRDLKVDGKDLGIWRVLTSCLSEIFGKRKTFF